MGAYWCLLFRSNRTEQNIDWYDSWGWICDDAWIM